MNSNKDSKVHILIKDIIATSSNIKTFLNNNDICDEVQFECQKTLKQSLDLLIKIEFNLKDQTKENKNQVCLKKFTTKNRD